MKIQEFDYSVDLLQAILWQYANSKNLIGLVNQKQEWYNENQSQFWQDWYDNVFNLQTANAFGLTVWSIILNIPLFILNDPDPPGKPIFGFNEVPEINDNENFENGNFSNITGIVLTLEEQRTLLRLRYFQLTSRGAIPEINNFLNILWGDQGGAWVLDGFDMTITYIFNFNLSYNLRQILVDYDLLPRPAGVGIKYIVDNGLIFGFGEDYQNFENGNFIPNFQLTF